MKPPSKRYTPNRWTEWVVPAVLLFLLLALIAALVMIGLSVLPGAGI
jgi:hypothetical protein